MTATNQSLKEDEEMEFEQADIELQPLTAAGGSRSNPTHHDKSSQLQQTKRGVGSFSFVSKNAGIALLLLAASVVVVASSAGWLAAHSSAHLAPETMTTKHESTKQNNSNNHLLLNTYTYYNCPLTMTKFSQFEMAKDGNFKSEQDKRTNSIDRAKLALDFSNDALAYERVVTALEKNAFNRTIVLDGDSLTRQLFISLGCLAWAAGYVTDFHMPYVTTHEGDTNTILVNSELHASSIYIGQASVTLRGGGTIYYVGTASREKIDKYQEHVMESCKSRKKIFEGRYSFDLTDLKPLSKKDIVVVAAGYHAERETIISYYKEFLECIREDDSDDHFQEWPKFFYQSMSNLNFWTMNGLIQGEKIPGKDWMSCQPSVNTTVFRTKESEILKGFVPLIGYDIKVEDLGEYHPGHGDCLHWIQPGVSDLYAAELADIALAMMEGE